jgi:hypothetical protein
MENEEIVIENVMSAKAEAVKAALQAETDRIGYGETRAGLMYFLTAATGEEFEALHAAISSVSWSE